MTPRPLRLNVNGTAEEIPDVPGPERLLDTLRWRLKLKGTKEGCRTGDCGACTVLVDGRSCLSCLTLAHEVDGSTVTTIEVGAEEVLVARVRAAFDTAGALQCGYCTPGFVMAVAGLLGERGTAAPREELLEGLGGNLCRCTGYAAIVRAVDLLRTEVP
ncbi:MAG: 2Fe-2S iron-sulfur cluster-binding protein [Thermoplasmata archaeon]|jgi:aerobic-type carbon monoxide dehydrogenase small subunit (CoxS/CutS family)|nr:2Fe-2S iron-sulfur cluster-binding protein [Thermoplasmata archaeon]